MTYIIQYYGADGNDGPEDTAIVARADTLEEARAEAREALGLKALRASRRWYPDEAEDDREAVEAYHALPASHPRAYGCGGVAIWRTL